MVNDLNRSLKASNNHAKMSDALTPDKMAIVIVGDRQVIEPGLRSIELWGKSIAFLDTEGNPIKSE